METSLHSTKASMHNSGSNLTGFGVSVLADLRRCGEADAQLPKVLGSLNAVYLTLLSRSQARLSLDLGSRSADFY